MASGNPTGVRLNLGLLWFTRHWLRVAMLVIGIFAGLPYLTPVLMKAGLTGPAQVLYTFYSPFCHQFAFRSFFLFGEQPTYPRSNTGTDQTPFEDYIKSLPEFQPDAVSPAPFGLVGDIYAFTPGFQGAARYFVGNDQMGYKMPLCERDTSMYSGIFVGGLIYARIRRRLRPVPIGLYVLLGLGPIAIDGVSQMLGYPPFNLWPARETLPIFRVVTGALFGLMNVWLTFPYIELSMADTRDQIIAKLQAAGIPF